LNNLNIWNLSEEDRKERGIASLPGSLAEAMREFESDEVIRSALGPMICDVFSRAKWAEVEEYRTRVTDWEIGRYLELA
jgi:glutamine synthetase